MSEVVRITRRAKGENVRMIEITNGRGRAATHRVLPTEIEKVKMPEKFFRRGSGVTAPVEQYGFKINVDGKVVVGERFADAAAMVLAMNGVKIPREGLDQKQAYVQRAAAILDGTDVIRDVTREFMTPVTEGEGVAANI